MNETKILSVENYCSVSLKFSDYACTEERNTLYLNQCERLSDLMEYSGLCPSLYGSLCCDLGQNTPILHVSPSTKIYE